MMCLPDAPWIRDAELNGIPEAEDFFCPVCGAENPEKFYVVDGEVIGCESCVNTQDAYDWHDRHRSA
jgi:hypothetical protein